MAKKSPKDKKSRIGVLVVLLIVFLFSSLLLLRFFVVNEEPAEFPIASTLEAPDLPEGYAWKSSEVNPVILEYHTEGVRGFETFQLTGSAWSTDIPMGLEKNPVETYYWEVLLRNGWKPLSDEAMYADGYLSLKEGMGGGPCRPTKRVMVGYKDGMFRAIQVSLFHSGCSTDFLTGVGPATNAVQVFVSDPVEFNEVVGDLKK